MRIMANLKELRWTIKDTRFLRAHIGDMSFMQLAQALNRSENSIRIKAHKLRLLTNINGKMRKRVTFNVVAKMIEASVSSVQNFKPTREFYTITGLSQKRFWGAVRGEFSLEPDELRRLAQYLNLNLEDWQKDCQLSINFDEL